jgi:hypothetical protein
MASTTYGDLMALSDAELLELRALGPAAVAAVRARCNHWLQRIAENLAAQKKTAV